MMMFGEVVFGGVGSGLYGMLVFVIVAVFVAGLMVGRTPEYLGKKIEAYEMKMAAVVILIPPMLVLVGAAAAVLNPSALASLANNGAHGFSEVSVRNVFSPAWTTDWLSDETREKMRAYGIAPPTGGATESAAELVTIRRSRVTVACPYCGSANTEEKSEFGSTACKAIHFCNSCNQPFDYFKPL